MTTGQPGAGPALHELGLSACPGLSWEQIGIEQPSPADLFGCPQTWTWADFGKAHPKAEAELPGPEAGAKDPEAEL